MINVACGCRVDLNEMRSVLNLELAKFDSTISDIKVVHGMECIGGFPHFQTDIYMARNLLRYCTSHSFFHGVMGAAEWYFHPLGHLS